MTKGEPGFVDGIYLGACYCHGDHVCSPCTIKKNLKEPKVPKLNNPRVLILVERAAQEQEINQAIRRKLYAAGEEFTLGQRRIKLGRQQNFLEIHFATIETLNRNYESLYGFWFANYFMPVNAAVRPTQKLLEFLTTRILPKPENKGVPPWLVNVLIGLNLI